MEISADMKKSPKEAFQDKNHLRKVNSVPRTTMSKHLSHDMVKSDPEIEFKRYNRRCKIIKDIKLNIFTDFVQLDEDDYRNFMFRIFSRFIYKPGVDYHVEQTSLLLILIFYLFLFYSKMGNNNQGILTILKSNNFSQGLVLIVYLTILVIVIERVIYLQNPSTSYDKKESKRWEVDHSLLRTTHVATTTVKKLSSSEIQDQTNKDPT